MSTGHVDISEFTRKLSEYKQLTGKGWQDVVKGQAKLLAQRLMQLTPPNNQGQGSKRVAIDIGRVFLGSEWFTDKFSFKSQHLQDSITNAVRAQDTNTLQTIFQRSPKLNRLHIEPFDASKHKAARRNGRVSLPEPFSFPLSGQAQLKTYQKAKQGNVGLAKSGWGACASALGARVPKWANKPGNGSVEDKSSLKSNPYVVLTNSVPYFSALDAKQSIVSRALAGRQRDMQKEAEKSLEQAGKVWR